MNLLMISGDSNVVEGKQGPFYYTLKEFSHHWDHIQIFCPKASTLKGTSLFHNITFYPSPFSRIISPLYFLFQGIKSFKHQPYDLILSHDYGLHLNGLAAIVLSLLLKIPYISEIHHVEGYPKAMSWKEKFLCWWTKVYLFFAKRFALGVRIVNKGDILQFMQEISFPPDKLLLLYSLYIDFEIFRPLSLPKKYDLMFCGRLVPNKGIFTILSALKILKEKFPSLLLLIKGSGPLKQEILNYIEVNHLKKNTELIEWVPTAHETVTLYNQSKIFICASTAEGGPRVTAEAMACGIPVISTPVGLMGEILRDGENGLLFKWDEKELAQKAQLLLENLDLQKRLGEKGRESIRSFESKKIICEYAEGVKRAVERSRSSSSKGRF